MRSLLRAASILAVASVAQAQNLDVPRLRALEAQVANVYAATATEADFTEARTLLPNRRVVWSGHATFTKTGFVLDYTNPAGRRVVSDLTATRVVDPTALQASSTLSARFSFYNKALALMTGAERPAFGSARQAGTTYLVVGDRLDLTVDMVTSRIVRVRAGDMAAGDIDNMSVGMEFTNIRSVATPIAASRIAAALRTP